MPGTRLCHRPGQQAATIARILLAQPNQPAPVLRRRPGLLRPGTHSQAMPGQPVAIDAEFCQYLYGCCKVHSQPVDTGANLPDRSLHRALSYIADHYSKPITVDAIAAASHVSASQLYNLFRAQLGKTPHQSLLQYRMEKAVQLLIHQRPIKQVVNACGFESESGFIRAFKKRYGIPPGEYIRDMAVV